MNNKRVLLTSPAVGRLIIAMYNNITTQKQYAKMLKVTEQTIFGALEILKRNNLITEKWKNRNKIIELNEDKLINICIGELKKMISQNFGYEAKNMRNLEMIDRLNSKGITINLNKIKNDVDNVIKNRRIRKRIFIKNLKKELKDTNFSNYIRAYYWLNLNNLSIPFIKIIKEYLYGVNYL